MLDKHRQAFIEEAGELLVELENSLLELESTPGNTSLIDKVFRALHTIKGSSGMFGFEDVSIFTHDIENVFDCLRNGEITISGELINLTLSAKDLLQSMITGSENRSAADEQKAREILAAFNQLMSVRKTECKENEEQNTPVPQPAVKQDVSAKRYSILFAPAADIFMSGTNPMLLLQELRELGECSITANVTGLPTYDEMDPSQCYLSWDIEIATSKGIDTLKDVFIFVEDSAVIRIEEIEIPETSGNLINQEAPQVLDLSTGTDEVFQPEHTHDAPGKKGKEPAADTASSIRVTATKLDELVNLVGELVIVQARLSALAIKKGDTELDAISEEVERLTWELRDSALNIRMLPIGTTFSKFKRLVRDLASDLGKKVELTTTGAETELDKTVIEKLNDPLVHIIRNCLDHGIENLDARRKAGKPDTGCIHLSASQSGGSVLIQITDDGKGLDEQAIREKAVRLGLIAPDAEPTKQEIFSFIFGAGFSTAAKVSNISGRGVGMDVVRRAIDSLRGTIEVDSEIGRGTSITLKIPLTLAIIDGLLVKIDDSSYVLPLSTVEECIELINTGETRVNERNIVNVRGEIVPFIRLRDHFFLSGPKPAIEQIVIVDVKGSRIGFVVDAVVGQHQTVIKNLGKAYKDVEGISGATILGDGTVALILDVVKLAQVSESEEKQNLK